eukprot:CAMPEP_0198577724 /NCGR_PEP_ID=MMETSP1462-20131121/119265_1 /TAXON_ID=1333877 /ORGANISM="Brandtodinium nutriculum, Strain RCC3387" /LENGTH=129 /DNA_ID=CAMNT_0044309007 /DNA_START=109 /DNA_END=495 /DNA_ORIENTATION=+
MTKRGGKINTASLSTIIPSGVVVCTKNCALACPTKDCLDRRRAPKGDLGGRDARSGRGNLARYTTEHDLHVRCASRVLVAMVDHHEVGHEEDHGIQETDHAQVGHLGVGLGEEREAHGEPIDVRGHRDA